MRHVILHISVMLTAAVASAQPVSLVGRLLAADTGLPIAGATISAVRHPASGGPMVFRSITRQDGTFLTESVPQGSYTLCVYDAKDYLDPCQWSEPLTITAAPGSARQVVIRVQRGARLSLRLADPSGFAADAAVLPSQVSHGAGPISAFFVDASGRRRVLPLVFQSDGIFEYAELAPADTEVLVVVANQRFLLSDAEGAPVADGHAIRVRMAPDATPSAIREHVRLPFSSVGPKSTTVALQIRGAQ